MSSEDLFQKQEKDELQKLEDFFDSDVRIKKTIYELCPPNDNGYLDDDSLIEYADQVNKKLNDIFYELKKITGEGNDFYKKATDLKTETIAAFLKAGIKIDKLREVYRTYVSDMKPEFVDSVNTSIKGYYASNPGEPLKKVTTINEMLHLLHQIKVNNHNLLGSIPPIAQKENIYHGIISLRGRDNPIFKDVFEKFPLELDCYHTELVSLENNRMIMMVRDRGHALTIDVTLNGDIARIAYFIPKSINLDMINSLPGVNKIHDIETGATGLFEVPVSELSNQLFDFISKVPMDEDYVKEDVRTL